MRKSARRCFSTTRGAAVKDARNRQITFNVVVVQPPSTLLIHESLTGLVLGKTCTGWVSFSRKNVQVTEKQHSTVKNNQILLK
jgi:hypothetical protein